MRTAYACWRCRRGTRRGNLGWEDWMTPGAAEGDVTCPKCNEELGTRTLRWPR
jgi:DNA-directed RNA polymerase subunit RPC12/RpoP